jgi:hypothetical protein
MILALLFTFTISVLGTPYGLCLDGITLPPNATVECDPPNMLPQICLLICPDGYYSSGTRDIACADSMCYGTCRKEEYTYNNTQLVYYQDECTYTNYVNCNTTASGLCLETRAEPCQRSHYTTTAERACRMVPDLREDCWNSGCMGTCDTGGTVRYHYYSKSCPQICQPWRDNASPQFQCTACSTPPRLGLFEYITPSQVRYICPPGSWGEPIVSYCMKADGSWYPLPIAQKCNTCTYPDIINDVTGDHTVKIGEGTIEIGCKEGYVGETVTMKCSQIDGAWTKVEYPECLIWSPSATPSISATMSISPVSASVTPSVTSAATASVSKTPRAPKVKGSRAPSPAPKALNFV